MTRAFLLLATRSAGKLRELRPMFTEAGLAVVSLADAGIDEDPAEAAVEAFDTFEENALAKARYFHARSGIPTVADDSGLVVDALRGAPGVRSKRWSGRSGLAGQALDDANNEKLRSAMPGAGTRAARYVCAAAYCDETRVFVVRGETEGEIVAQPRGSQGFGYDPWFYSHELAATFGESPLDAKEVVSHRGRAFRALIKELAVR